MKPVLKIIVDIAMAVLITLLMSYGFGVLKYKSKKHI